METQFNNQSLPPIQDISAPKKWYQRKGVRAIMILAILAVIVSSYYLKQQRIFVDYRPFPVHKNSPVVTENQSNKLIVTSPNGGEKWKLGSMHLVTWAPIVGILNKTGNENVFDLAITGENPNKCQSSNGGVICQAPIVYTIARKVSTNGSYSWTIDKVIKPGKYKLIVILPLNDTTVLASDESDNYFEIQSADDKNTLESPPLFSSDQVRWQEITFDSHNPSFEFALGYNNFNYQTDPKKRLENFIPLPGHLWVAAKVSDSAGTNLDQIRDNFIKYYENVLKQSGWNFTQDIPSRQISINGPSADGALSSVWGYIKIQDSSIRLIGLSYNESVSKWINVPDSAPNPACPCEMEFKVFVSDIIDVSKLKF